MSAAVPRLLTSGHPARPRGSRLRCCVALGRRVLRAGTSHGARRCRRGRWSTRGSRTQRFRNYASAGKCRMKHRHPTRSAVEICNERLERLLREPACRELASGPRTRSAGCDDPFGSRRARARGLRRPSARRSLVDAVPPRSSSDPAASPAPRSASSAARVSAKRPSSTRPAPLGALDHVAAIPAARRRARSSRASRATRGVVAACAARRTATSRASHAAELAPSERARSRSSSQPSVRPASRRRPRPESSATATVELDGDAARAADEAPSTARPSRCPGSASARPPLATSSTSATTAGLDVPGCAGGRSRAETTWSGPASAWIRREDRLHEVGVLLQERRGVLAALAEPLVAEGEVRARLRDDLPLEADVEHGALPRDARARR